MADIQLVIEIPEEEYQNILHTGKASFCTVNAIEAGTPLPKGHGDLIDRNKIEYLKAIHDAIYGHITWSDATARIKYSAPTIIEADKTVIEKEVQFERIWNHTVDEMKRRDIGGTK